jgi:DNA-binding CsgD family transcriptional regulator
MIAMLCGAFTIARMFDRKAAEAATFADTLDGLDAGLYLVDAEARLIHANIAGRAILDASDMLQECHGHLAACDPAVNQTLRDVFAAAGQADSLPGAGAIAVPLIGMGDRRHVAHVLPLSSGARQRSGVAYRAVAALFVRRAVLVMPPRSEVIGEAFKLTPTELRVLFAIVEVGGIPEVAAVLGVADTTVRTHVSRLFEKTGTARQADLVKLVAGYATPLKG